jgi:hypothetical protein
MARLLQLTTVDLWNELEFREKSKQLDEFLRGDFTSIDAELRAAFPRTDGLQRRFIPLVQRYADELSGLYARPVVRRFLPATMPREVWQKLGEVYDSSHVDHALDQAERFAWTQNTALMVVLPRDLRRVCVHVFAPFQCEPTVGDPMHAGDPSTWQKLEIAVPGQIDAGTGAVVMGRMLLSRTEAWVEVGGRRRGLFDKSGSNPLGRIPVVVVRRVPPAAGRAFAPVHEALLNLHIALCIQESDTELLVHTQAWGQRVIEGAEVGQLTEEIAVGPEKILALTKSDPAGATSPRLTVVQSNPPISQIVSWQEARIRLLCSMLGLSGDAFLRVNTALTASARMFAEQDRRGLRDKIRPVFERAETELARLIAATLNLTEPLQVPVEPLTVDVRWQDNLPAVDPLHDAQALELEIKLGLKSPADIVAERDGIGRTEALAAVKRNLAEAAEVAKIGKPEPEPEPPEPDAAGDMPDNMPPSDPKMQPPADA